MKLIMFDTKEYDITSFNEVLDEYKENISIKYIDTRLDIDTVKLAKGYEGIISFVNDDLSNEVIKELYSLGIKVIFLRSAGYNLVDLDTCKKYNIKVYRVPSYSPEAVAEHAFALLLTSIRRIHKAYNRIREYNFSLVNLEGSNLYGKTVGVIGTGKIGKAFIKIAKGFSMNVLAYDMYQDDSLKGIVEYVSLDTLYQQSDIISLHIPLSELTYHLINKDAINKMKKGVVLINTSRGALIDSEALLEGISNRRIGSALLDVYEEESEYFYLDKSNHIMDDETLRSLISMPNVIITSHQGFLTKEALENISRTTLDNVISYINNIESRNQL